MRVRVTHGIDDLAGDLRRIATTTRPRLAKVVRKNAEQGNRLAKSIAKESAGAHGKHYHKAFSAEAITPLIWEYGPDSAMPQGGMSFEYGSRNQPPHLDLNKSADVQGPRLEADVDSLMDGLFWVTATQVDIRPHFTAVQTKLNAALSPNFAYAIDAIPGSPQNADEDERNDPLPDIYVELGVEQRYVPPRGNVPASTRGGWRITARCVGRTVLECEWAMNKVTGSLRNGRYTTGGDIVKTFLESGQQPEWDDVRFSALLVFTASH